MECLIYIILAALFIGAQGLKCRVEQDTQTQDEFDSIVRSCMRQENVFPFRNINNNNNNNNNTNRNNKENNQGKGNNRNDNQNKNSFQGMKQQSDNKYEKDDDDDDYNYDYESERDNKKSKDEKQRRRYPQYNRDPNNRHQGNKYSNSTKNQGNNNFRGSGSPLEGVDPCIIHCILKQKKMLNNDNYVDKTNVIRVLSRKIRNAELREFIEDSINECFDVLENERSKGKCEDSKNFVLCLEEKGKENCEDWDPNQNKDYSNKNQHNSDYDRPNYYQNNEKGSYNSDKNYDRPYSGQSYNNRDRDRQNRYPNDKNYSEEKYNNGYQYNQNKKDRDRSNTNGNNNNYYYSNDNKSNDRSNNNQGDENKEDKFKFSEYFQSRG